MGQVPASMICTALRGHVTGNSKTQSHQGAEPHQENIKWCLK